MTVAAVLATLVVAGTAACSSSEDRAFEHAVEDARASVGKGRDQLDGVAALGRGVPDATAALGADRVFGSRDVEGGFELDAVFYGRGEGGGGGTYERTSVRICVRFLVRPNGSPRVDEADTECAPSLPTSVPMYGTVTRTVRLK